MTIGHGGVWPKKNQFCLQHPLNPELYFFRIPIAVIAMVDILSYLKVKTVIILLIFINFQANAFSVNTFHLSPTVWLMRGIAEFPVTGRLAFPPPHFRSVAIHHGKLAKDRSAFLPLDEAIARAVFVTVSGSDGLGLAETLLWSAK